MRVRSVAMFVRGAVVGGPGDGRQFGWITVSLVCKRRHGSQEVMTHKQKDASHRRSQENMLKL
jgi:hypothetical protein